MQDKHLIILAVIAGFALTGCDNAGFMTEKSKVETESTVTVVPMDDPQLAKLILKPKPNTVKVSRDPFKPIYDWNEKRTEAKIVEPVKQRFDDVTFIGIIKMGEQSIALLKSKEKKVMLKVNDQYKGFVVTEISNAQVTLSDGVAKITLKRGIKK